MTFAEEIENFAGHEQIVACVIGPFGWDGYLEEEVADLPVGKREVVLTWDEAKPSLSYEYHSSYGAPQCHAVTVWTAKRVIFVSQYDGATALHSVPRDLVDHKPEMPGG